MNLRSNEFETKSGVPKKIFGLLTQWRIRKQRGIMYLVYEFVIIDESISHKNKK